MPFLIDLLSSSSKSHVKLLAFCKILIFNTRIHREPSLVLCDDLEGWDWGKEGTLKREMIYV